MLDPTLGIDYYLDQSGDLFLDGNGELVMINGPANVQQNISLRLVTNFGDYILDISYGSTLPQYVGKLLPKTAIAGLQADIASALLQDPNIAKVNYVQIIPGTNGTIDVLVNVTDITGTQVAGGATI